MTVKLEVILDLIKEMIINLTLKKMRKTLKLKLKELKPNSQLSAEMMNDKNEVSFFGFYFSIILIFCKFLLILDFNSIKYKIFKKITYILNKYNKIYIV
jgi:uncharacterized protein YdaL